MLLLNTNGELYKHYLASSDLTLGDLEWLKSRFLRFWSSMSHKRVKLDRRLLLRIDGKSSMGQFMCAIGFDIECPWRANVTTTYILSCMTYVCYTYICWTSINLDTTNENLWVFLIIYYINYSTILSIFFKLQNTKLKFSPVHPACRTAWLFQPARDSFDPLYLAYWKLLLVRHMLCPPQPTGVYILIITSGLYTPNHTETHPRASVSKVTSCWKEMRSGHRV